MLIDENIIRTKQSMFAIVKQKFFKLLSKKNRKKINKSMQQRLKQKDVTIIASFCGGGTIYHDLDLKFLSPTINTAFDGPDFCRFCCDLKKNLNEEIKEAKTSKVNYPVGKIGNNIEIRFVHYDNFENAKIKWNQRRKRVNYDKILILATDRDGMYDEECLKSFDKLPYKKIMFTSKKYPYDWAIYCDYFKHSNNVGIMTGISGLKGNRYYEDYIDIVELLNNV